jgi:hypothetical protein
MPGTQKIVKPAEARASKRFDACGAAACVHGEDPNPKRQTEAIETSHRGWFALARLAARTQSGHLPGRYALIRHFTPLYAWLWGLCKKRTVGDGSGKDVQAGARVMKIIFTSYLRQESRVTFRPNKYTLPLNRA